MDSVCLCLGNLPIKLPHSKPVIMWGWVLWRTMWLISMNTYIQCLLLGGDYSLHSNYSMRPMFVKERMSRFWGSICLTRCDRPLSDNPGQNTFCLTQSNLWCSSWSSEWPIPHRVSLSGWKCCSVAVVLLVGCRFVLPSVHMEQRSMHEFSDGWYLSRGMWMRCQAFTL